MAIVSPAPGVLPYLEAETDEFQAKAKSFRDGEIDAATFRAWRLTRGTYGQRQADNQMIRIKIPFGGLNADQLDAIGDVAERWAGSNKGHITTRENIQLHFVQLETVPDVMRTIGAVGLTTREACSNTVRNVTACSLAGVDATEAFDVTPYAAAFARYFLRKPENQALPRKFKTAFSGCEEDCAVLGIHDLGFHAVMKNGQKGFLITAGGGTATMPRQGHVISEFSTVDDGEYLRVSEAVLAVFDKTGNRKNKNAARMKFVVEKHGWDQFKTWWDEEYAKVQGKQIDMAPLMDLPDETAGLPQDLPHADPIPGYDEWRRTNVVAQKQPGFYAAYVTVPTGDLYPEMLHGLADISRRHNGGWIRLSVTQNVVVRWLREEQLPALHRDLFEIGLGQPGARTLVDVVSCPGATSCSLAMTASIEMARMGIGSKAKELVQQYPEAAHIRINVSGCPNGCGQHHLGTIGFEGSSIKKDLLTVPAYEMWAGGGHTETGLRIAKRVNRIAAKRAPQALEAVVAAYSGERSGSEDFYGWLDRVGIAHLKEITAEFCDVGPLHKELDSYKDWGSDEVYQVIRGEGECAA